MKILAGIVLGVIIASAGWTWQLDRMNDRHQVEVASLTRAGAHYQELASLYFHRKNEAIEELNKLRKHIANMSDFICGPKGKLVIGENSYTCKNRIE